MAQPLAGSALAVGLEGGRCAWLGPTSGGLGWLFQRLAGAPPCSAPLRIEGYPEIDVDLLRRLSSEGGVERIILACSTRLEYPLRAIEFLQRSSPDIPFAVACDSWWDGARRTGLGKLEPLVLPWYRWWDGWMGWLEGSDPEMFSPCQGSVAPWAHSGRSTSRAPGDEQRSLVSRNLPAADAVVVGNCRTTCAAWSCLGQALAFQTTICSWHKFRQHEEIATHCGAPQWILWDDSCLNTSGSQAARDVSLRHFIDSARQTFPGAWLIAATSVPRVDAWRDSSPGRAVEWIVKPDSGQGLRRLLMHIRSTAVALQPR